MLIATNAGDNNESRVPIHPGDLWRVNRRPVIVCGNCTTAAGALWCMRWYDGVRVDAPINRLSPHPERAGWSQEEIVERFHYWATQGNSDAMWWLAWLFEGRNHHKSTWYYVAAMRAAPSRHGWAYYRIMSDSQFRLRHMGVPAPDLSFLGGIPEICGKPIGSDWKSAVRAAHEAVHIPASPEADAEAKAEGVILRDVVGRRAEVPE